MLFHTFILGVPEDWDLIYFYAFCLLYLKFYSFEGLPNGEKIFLQKWLELPTFIIHVTLTIMFCA